MAAKKTTGGENLPLQQLKADLKDQVPARLYLFFGEEVYLRDSYLNRLKALLLPDGFEDFNLHHLQGKACTPQELEQAIDCLPMMSQRTLVLIEDYDLFKAPQAEQKAYAALLEALPDYVCVLFLYDTIKLDRRSIKGELARLLKNSTALVEFRQQSATDLIPWISRHMKQAGKDISRSEAEYLIFVTGGSMSALVSEMEKVAAFARGTKIQRSDIDAVCDPVLDAVTFQMTDCISQGNFDRAMEILSELIAMQTSPHMILGALSRQLRQMYTARLAFEEGQSAQWLAELWGMNQSWQADRLLRNSRRFSPQWYRRAVLLIAEADRRSKLTATEVEQIITELLLRLAQAA